MIPYSSFPRHHDPPHSRVCDQLLGAFKRSAGELEEGGASQVGEAGCSAPDLPWSLGRINFREAQQLGITASSELETGLRVKPLVRRPVRMLIHSRYPDRSSIDPPLSGLL